MAKIKEDQYAFPCAIIRANEKTLLDGAALDRVLESDQSLVCYDFAVYFQC